MITTPTLNSNGTSPRDLLEQHMVAMQALMVAIKLVRAAAPNARDYQTCKFAKLEFTKAQEEHAIRLNHLDTVMRELDEIAQTIVKQRP